MSSCTFLFVLFGCNLWFAQGRVCEELPAAVRRGAAQTFWLLILGLVRGTVGIAEVPHIW